MFLAGSSSLSWHDLAGLGDNHLATVEVIALQVRFDWRNFALALSAQISIVEFSAELRVVLV